MMTNARLEPVIPPVFVAAVENVDRERRIRRKVSPNGEFPLRSNELNQLGTFGD
jgi:hypothetical protein